MCVAICNRFPALTPFSVRAMPAREVFLLIRRLNIYDKRQKQKPENKFAKKGRIVRPAGDNWF